LKNLRETSFGLLLVISLDGKLMAILQRRGEFNHETMSPESWPGACQVTVHGKAIVGEELGTAIKRETIEEIGEPATEMLLKYYALDAEPGAAAKWFHTRGTGNRQGVFTPASARERKPLVLLSEVKTETKRILTFGALAPLRILPIIRLNASTGGIRLLGQEETDRIVNVEQICAKEQGVSVRGVVAMFPDEIEAVRKAFTLWNR
jgi:hypothetical protein